MVSNGKSYQDGWFGGPPLLGNLHIIAIDGDIMVYIYNDIYIYISHYIYNDICIYIYSDVYIYMYLFNVISIYIFMYIILLKRDVRYLRLAVLILIENAQQ